MPIPSEDLAIGRAAFKRVKAYESNPTKGHSSKRYLIYLIPACWLASSVLRCEVKPSYWNIFQIVFWLSALLWLVVVTEKRSKVNSQDHVILEDLRKKYGSDVSFEEENDPIDVNEKAAKVIKAERQKKFIQIIVIYCFGAWIFSLYLRYFLGLIHK